MKKSEKSGNLAKKRHKRSVFYAQSLWRRILRAKKGETWADGFNFSQDEYTRLFSAKNDSSTEKDLKGGWFDAGDYNKYTKWTADYIETMLLTFEENPEVFSDDYGIPESGNGVPDILDEAKWGINWLLI